MYYYFPLDGPVEKLDDAAAGKKMDEISPQWEEENSPMGKVYLGVHDWAYTEKDGNIEVLVPNLREGGSVPENNMAQKLIGGKIYGDCFLKPKDADVPEIDRRLAAIV